MRYYWLTSPPPALPSPGELAQDAVAKMDLSGINIGIVPKPGQDTMGIIGLPVWMWVDQPTPGTYGPIAATATAGPMTVTATGRVTGIDWVMGDGSTVTCRNAGTAYQASDGTGNSPNCGYTYTKTSANRPHDAYTVTATSHWQITWTGGGQSGVITLDHTASTQIREGELQVLNR